MIRIPRDLISRPTHHALHRCHRGLGLRVWLNSTGASYETTCLCPPSFYGDHCQYQNQRVSLTLRVQVPPESLRTLFILILSLIDDSERRTIHSSHKLTYISTQDCQAKFDAYFTYATRPKNGSCRYSVHVDIYEQLSLTYRGSLSIPLAYPFLPVHRLAVRIDIPRKNERIDSCSDNSCVNGRCSAYANDGEGKTFCQCNAGWTGKHCTIPYICACSADSLCIGILANNRSLCVCPINRFGSKCLIERDAYCQHDQKATCYNGGRCVTIHEHVLSNTRSICICPKGFSGSRCQTSDARVVISFQNDVLLSETILVHFIEVMDDAPPESGVTFKTRSLNQDTITVYWPRPFHIALVELYEKNYYLAIVQKTYNRSATAVAMINSSDRCMNIREIFNETIVNLHLVRRIKHYHVPCEASHSPRLSCFYDDIHLCLCESFGEQRLANCFEFDHQMRLDCSTQGSCQHGAQCLQDRLHCPQQSVCVCPRCFYGSQCQFSTNGFALSLDPILGYHVLPHVSFKHQPSIVHASVALTACITTAGFINGILLMITFHTKKLREVGTGIYLLGSSITTQLAMILLALKFSIFVASQMMLIRNRAFLRGQCILLDFLLRVCLGMDQWLDACVAMDRAYIAVRGLYFEKQKSKRAAKAMVIVLVILTISTTIHDPIHRQLFDEGEGDEQRTWCISSYSSTVQVLDSASYLLHFVIPFLLNLTSAVTIIVVTTRQRSTVQADQTYRQVLRKQIQQHGHLLIPSLMLIVLALPRIVISFFSSCMKSGRDSWLFLVGYLISFIPPMLTFVLFVVPSALYKASFYASLSVYKRKIPSFLRLSS